MSWYKTSTDIWPSKRGTPLQYFFLTGKHLNKAQFDNNHYSQILEDVNCLENNDFHVTEESGDSSDEDSVNEAITTDEINWAIHKQECVKKSKDGAGIHPKMLKHLPKLAITLLSFIYNMVIDSGNWEWKESFITFIKKSDKPSYLCPGANRPLAPVTEI